MSTINPWGLYSRGKFTDTVEAMLQIIRFALESGRDVLISDFVKIQVKDKKERQGRNKKIVVTKW